jgi:hypothetical protein
MGRMFYSPELQLFRLEQVHQQSIKAIFIVSSDRALRQIFIVLVLRIRKPSETVAGLSAPIPPH